MRYSFISVIYFFLFFKPKKVNEFFKKLFSTKLMNFPAAFVVHQANRREKNNEIQKWRRKLVASPVNFWVREQITDVIIIMLAFSFSSIILFFCFFTLLVVTRLIGLIYLNLV